jgi:predicted amidohydrolase
MQRILPLVLPRPGRGSSANPSRPSRTRSKLPSKPSRTASSWSSRSSTSSATGTRTCSAPRCPAGLAEPLDGPSVKELQQLAADLGIWLVPGSVCERGPEGQLFNTQLVLSPEGELAGYYRKIFPWRPFEPYDPGDRFTTVDLAGIGRVGLNICYDAWYPEVSRQLAWMGAEVILNVVKTTTPDRRQELVLAKANAIVNQVFVVSVNCAGPTGQGQEHHRRPRGQHHRGSRGRRNRCCSQRTWTWPPSNTSAPTGRRTSTAPGPSSGTARPPSNCPSTRAGSIR